MRPTVGRIVHYTTGRLGVCEAAIVVAVKRSVAPDGEPVLAHLAVFSPFGGVRGVQNLPETDPSYPPGAPDVEGWHWPEREA
jgi:hypothetical protein